MRSNFYRDTNLEPCLERNEGGLKKNFKITPMLWSPTILYIFFFLGDIQAKKSEIVHIMFQGSWIASKKPGVVLVIYFFFVGINL